MCRMKIMTGLMVLLFSHCAQPTDFPVLNGPYFGQSPPGDVPELFAPDLLSAGGDEASITFSPDGMECCYTLWTPGGYSKGPFQQKFIFYSREEKGCWTEPRELPFNPDRKSMYPFFSPDGKRLYFSSRRGGIQRTMFAEKSNGMWRHPSAIDLETSSFISVAANGNLYLAALDDRTGMPCLYVSRYQNGAYSQPEKLSDAINDEGGLRPYIAPDEHYIIFDREVSEHNIGNKDEEDLYISFRDERGEWMKAVNMGEKINTPYRDKRAFVSFDGKYLFFASSRIEAKPFPKDAMNLNALRQILDVPADGSEHIYWVDAKVIDQLKPAPNKKGN